MRQETKYNKIVNIAEDGEITVLDYTFIHSDSFKGAVGNTFYPVSKAYYKQQTTLKAIAERLEEAVPENEIPFKYSGYRMWAKAIKAAGEEKEFMFDTSYSELWDYLREATGLSEKDTYIFECTGGGRCFDKDYQGNTNPELSTIIREFEN